MWKGGAGGEGLMSLTMLSDDRTWRKVRGELFPRQDRLAFNDYLASRAAVLGDCSNLVPQPFAVSRRLYERTGFEITPVDGLVRSASFFAALRQGRFTANTNMRRPEEWRFCPSPDWIHETVGHAASLGDSRVASLYRKFGEVAALSSDKEHLRRLGRLFWYVFEVGLVRENGAIKAFGAAILSSLAELESIGRGELREFDPAVMAGTAYDYKDTQPMYFVADGVDELVERLNEHLDGYRGSLCLSQISGST